MNKPHKVDKSDGVDAQIRRWLKYNIPAMPCYVTGEFGSKEVSVVPMHNFAGGTAMKSMGFMVTPGRQDLHNFQHAKGFYKMLAHAFPSYGNEPYDGWQVERTMRRLFADAGSCLSMKFMLGVPKDLLLSEKGNEIGLKTLAGMVK